MKPAQPCKSLRDFQLGSAEVKPGAPKTSKLFQGGCAILIEFVRGPPGFLANLRSGNCSEAMKHRIVE